jgi:hypothetical protein
MEPDRALAGAGSGYGPGDEDKADLDKLRRGGIDAVAFAKVIAGHYCTPAPPAVTNSFY